MAKIRKNKWHAKQLKYSLVRQIDSAIQNVQNFSFTLKFEHGFTS